MADTETATRGRGSQMWKHQDAVNWLTEQGHINPQSSQAEVIAAFAARRNEYRRTDRYRSLVDNHAETAGAEREAAKAAKAAERQAAKEAKAAEKAAQPAKATRASKAAATEAAPAAPAKAKRGARKAAAAASEENPFD
jgi:hypothetical protein